MATVTLDIPDALAEVAERAGLLNSAGMEEALRTLLKQDRTDAIWGIGSRDVWPPISEDEIRDEVNGEIKAYRAERRAAGS